MVYALSLKKLNKLGLSELIKKEYSSLQKNYGRISPKLLGILLEPSTRIALDSILVKERIAATRSQSANIDDDRVDITDNQSDIPVDDHTKQFLGALIKPTLRCAGEESFIDRLGSVISKGLRIALPITKSAAVGLAALSNITSTEAAIVNTKQDQHLRLLAKRAILGEVALQAARLLTPRPTLLTVRPQLSRSCSGATKPNL